MLSFVAADRPVWAFHAGAPGGPPARRRPLLLVGVAAAHLGLLIAVGHALRLPVLPQALATLTVQLVSADVPTLPAPAPLVAPPRPPVPALTLPLPPVVMAEVSPAPRPAEPTITVAPAPAPPTPMPVQAVVPTVVPPPPKPAAPAADRQVSISQVEYLAPPVLAYPLAARRLREQGQVLVRVRVDEQGRPDQAVLQQSSGSTRLDEAALAAVAATRFKPYREGGVARPFWVVMPLVFSLEN